MSVIIRLQNLPWSANAFDIRQYFHGLSIPEGGVHIVGGELGDAFIAFSTDEDARQAFNRNNGKIKEVQITLLLSSRTEMQKVIESARSQSMAAFMTTVPAPPSIMPAIVPSAVPDIKDKRDRRRSRSKSRERKERTYDKKRDRRRDRSRSKSRERRDRRRDRRERSRSRDKSRSRDRERKDRRDGRRSEKSSSPRSSNNIKEHRVGVWEAPPNPNQNIIANQANSANLLANFVANNILPNILTRNNLENNQNNQRDKTLWDQNKSSFQSNDDSKNKSFNNYSDESRSNFNNGGNRDNFGKDKRRDREESYPNCCVKLQPFFGAFGEIRRFFNGLFIHNNGIKFINDEYGKRTGIVYIKFAYPEGKDEALGRTGDRIRNQLITVDHIGDDEFEAAIDRFLPDNEETDDFKTRNFNRNTFSCLTIDNLPIYVTEQSIRKIFAGMQIISIIFEVKLRYKCAYIKFANSNDASRAHRSSEPLMLDGKALNLEPCSDETFENFKKEHSNNDDLKPTNTLLMTGLPMKCSERDIVDFFSDIGVVPAKINLMTNESGFIGEAVCEFFKLEDSVLGYQKNGMPFGSGTVSMKYHITNKPSKQTSTTNNQNPRMSMPQQMNNMNIMPQHMNMNMNNMNRPPFFQPRNNFMGGPRGPPRPPMNMMGNHMGPRGPPMRRFPPPPHMQQNMQQNMQPNMQQNMQQNMQSNMEEEPEEELAPPGCVLLMENVPYKAGLDEILDFLDGFDVPVDNVLRKYNPNGLPSGETKVIFNSPNEVYQVIEDKKGARIRDRLIYLTQI